MSFSSFIFSQSNDLFISEYCEGSSVNRYLELYNGTSESIDLTSYEIWLSRGSNSSMSWEEPVRLLVFNKDSSSDIDLDPDFVAFHHILRLLMILFTVPIMVNMLNKK